MKPKFKSFPEIKRLHDKITMNITQKIHGTNACILIYETPDGALDLVCGSRSRWIYPGDDNYGFAAFVNLHKQEFIDKLGVGYHPGEWAGPGINSGEGLIDKIFVLFDFGKYSDGRELPPNTTIVPVLYNGPIDMSKIDECMEDLKTNGSKLQPGFMRVEGIVVNLNGTRYKKVFEAEETQWTGKSKDKGPKIPRIEIDYTYLCQPIRLEKLLSRDEKYITEYPKSLGLIVKDYVADLVKENQITGDQDEIKATTKGASSQIFTFVRTVMNERGYDV